MTISEPEMNQQNTIVQSHMAYYHSTKAIV